MNLEDARYYVYLKKDGSISYDSRFLREFTGNLDFLHSCVEDNIVDSDYEDDDEIIDWENVFKDYEKQENNNA